jgi:NAD(P)-dependent dehydrogenase (short-subunit alcohol dehydrogenase family)
VSDIRFDGKVALITGAGGGLGKTYALDLARRGCKVVVNDLGGKADGTGASASMADTTVKEIESAGGLAVANYDSVATPEGGKAMVQAAIDNFGRIDIVINNAGILRDKTFAKLEPADLEIVLDVHLKGAFYVSQPAFIKMKEQNFGRFIFTASAAGLLGNFGQTNYGAAKMGLVGLCNVLAPIARTRLTEQLLGPMAETLDAECVTPLVTYLVSEQSDLTHNIFSVGGGRYARMFVGLTKGWFAGKGGKPSAEQIRDNMARIRDTEGYLIPDSIADEMKEMLKAFSA